MPGNQNSLNELSAWKQISRSANYETVRATEQIREEWKDLPLFKLLSPKGENEGIIRVGFIRKVHQEHSSEASTVTPCDQSGKPPPPFNASMVTAKELKEISDLRDHDGEPLVDSKGTINKAFKDRFANYANLIEISNPNRPSTRRALRFWQEVADGKINLNHCPQGMDNDTWLDLIHHQLVELYRRMPYTGVLNDHIYPVLQHEELRALFFEAAQPLDPISPDGTFPDRLPDFVRLPCNAASDPKEARKKQVDFQPFLNARQQKAAEQKGLAVEDLKTASKTIHNSWLRSVELPEKATAPTDFLCVAIPIWEEWTEVGPTGSYLGHLLILLGRDNFIPDKVRKKSNRGSARLMRELQASKNDEDRKQAQAIWESMSRFANAATAFLRGNPSGQFDDDDWFAPDKARSTCDLSCKHLGRMHWETIRRNLNRFAQICYESEFDEWLDIEFPDNASHADVRRALESAAKHADGWTPVDCPQRQEKSQTDTKTKSARDYTKYFKPYNDGRTVHLKLQSKTRNPGDRPEERLDLCLQADPDTIIRGTEREKDNYFLCLYKRYNHLYQHLLQRLTISGKGQQSGLLESAHDYSRDLNMLDSHLAGFSADFLRMRNEVESIECRSVEEFRRGVLERVDQLRLPEERWLLAARFMMAHQRTLTEGRLYEQPEWCLNLIKRGTRGALYRLIKLLVWLPISWKEHVDFAAIKESGDEHDSAESELGREGLSDWARLFAYDERGRDAEVDDALGEYIRHLFCVEQITEVRFWQLHPPPQLNPGTPMTTPLLWQGLDQNRGQRWKPTATLCPLLVFSLRAAFQHAWLDLFLQAAGHWREGKPLDSFQTMTPSVTLESIDEGMGISITFPNPNSDSVEGQQTAGAVELPWGNWRREVARYTDKGLCHPWRIDLSHDSTIKFKIRITAGNRSRP